MCSQIGQNFGRVIVRFSQTLIATLIKLLTGVEAYWQGCAPKVVQRIYFANHCSHLDFPVLWASLPASVRQSTVPIAAADYWNKNALTRTLATKIFHATLVERRKEFRLENPLDQLEQALTEGKSLIIFPEGGRSEDGLCKPFKSGIYYLSKAHPNLEFVPVHIDNTDRILPKGAHFPIPLRCFVHFGEPISANADESRDQFLSRAHEAVLKCAS